MKLIVTLFSLLLVMGMAGLFVLKKPDGSPWFSLQDFVPSLSVDSIKSSVSEVLPKQTLGGGDSDAVTVYRWQDAEGAWQYSDKPPENLSAEMVIVETDLNRDLVPELKPSEKKLKQSSGPNVRVIKDSRSANDGVPTLLSPDKVQSLIGDAKNVQKLVDEHAAKQREQLESIH
jgi:hypothetical protein